MTELEGRLKKLEKRTDKAPEVNVPRDPLEFAALLGVELDPYQRELLILIRESTEKREPLRVLINASRQSGKSFICALAAAHFALTTRNGTCVIVSPTLRQSGLLFRRVMQFYNASGRPVPPVAESVHSLKLENGAWVVSLPSNEETIRGISSVGLVFFEEAARCSDALYYSVLPMLATVPDSKVIALSTPAGRRGFFYKEWAEGDNWKRIEVKATECKRISAEFLTDAHKRLGPYWFRSEFMCSFEANEAALFRHEVVSQCIRDFKPLDSVLDQAFEGAPEEDSDTGEEFEIDELNIDFQD